MKRIAWLLVVALILASTIAHAPPNAQAVDSPITVSRAPNVQVPRSEIHNAPFKLPSFPAPDFPQSKSGQPSSLVDVHPDILPGDGTNCWVSDQFYVRYEIRVNGTCLMLTHNVYMRNGRVNVHLRELLQVLGMSAYQSGLIRVEETADNTAWVHLPEVLLGFPLDLGPINPPANRVSPFMYYDGQTIPLDESGFRLNDHGELGAPYVPMRYLLEHLDPGTQVTYRQVNGVRIVEVPQFRWHFGNEPDVVCQDHGYSSTETCPGDQFFLGRWAYGTWGSSFLRDQIRLGTITRPGHVALINQMAIQKRGNPLDLEPDWVGAFIETGNQIATAAWVGSIFKNSPALLSRWYGRMPWGQVPQAELTEIVVNGTKPTTGTGYWWRPNSWSRNSVVYQAQKTGQPWFALADGKFTIQEYLYNGVEFDSAPITKNGITKFIEAKSDDGWFARMQSMPYFRRAEWEESLLSEALGQYNAVAGTSIKIEWHVQSASLAMEISRVLYQLPADVKRVITVYYSP